MDLHTVTDLLPAPGQRWRQGDAFLAGGTWVFSEPQPGLTRLLDLTAYDWPALTRSTAGLQVAATCTLAELGASSFPDWPAASAFGPCCDALLGSFKVHRMATVGGNLCLALPAGPMTALCAALDGVCTVWCPDGSTRSVDAVDFVTGPSVNCLRPGELLRAIDLPASALSCRVAVRQESLSPMGRSAALVLGRLSDGGEAVFTVTASTTRPVQLRFDALPDVAEVHAALEHSRAVYHDDVHGDPEWRAHLTRRMLAGIRDELAGAA